MWDRVEEMERSTYVGGEYICSGCAMVRSKLWDDIHWGALLSSSRWRALRRSARAQSGASWMGVLPSYSDKWMHMYLLLCTVQQKLHRWRNHLDSVHALSRCSHCLWHVVTSQTPPQESSQVGHDHLYMPGVQDHDHPASVGHKLWHSWQRDSELVNSSLHPPHSGLLCLSWAVHGQSLYSQPHKPTASSPGHSEGRLEDMTLPL